MLGRGNSYGNCCDIVCIVSVRVFEDNRTSGAAA